MRSLLVVAVFTSFLLQAGGCARSPVGTITDGQDSRGYTDRGNELQKNGDLDGAIAEYRSALRLNPNFLAAHYNLGSVFQTQGRKAEAKEEFKEVLRLFPDTPANQHKINQVKQRIRELE